MANGFNVLSGGDESGAPLGIKDQTGYMAKLVETMWRYREERFAGREELFDRDRRSGSRPPVFRRGYDEHNVIVQPGAPDEVNARVIAAVPAAGRHRWFRSMKSSQALVQSVFANLAVHDALDVLAGVTSDDGEPAFGEAPRAAALERRVDYLGEPTPTSVDVMVQGSGPVAVECKLTEWEVGSCSRPLADDEDPRYCNGSYTHQNGRAARCQLTEIGVRYWEYVPRLFDWAADRDLRPCPLRFTFQLVRNVLAACVRADGTLDPAGHALLVYDTRNPAFAEGGAGLRAWRETREHLEDPARLRRVSWQRLLRAVAERPGLGWLTGALAAKYGLVPSPDVP